MQSAKTPTMAGIVLADLAKAISQKIPNCSDIVWISDNKCRLDFQIKNAAMSIDLEISGRLHVEVSGRPHIPCGPGESATSWSWTSISHGSGPYNGRLIVPLADPNYKTKVVEFVANEVSRISENVNSLVGSGHPIRRGNEIVRYSS